MRQHNVEPEQVIRDEAGNITMLRFFNYDQNPLAPTSYVSRVGGIFRVENMIRVTLIDSIPNPRGSMDLVEQSHVMWKTPAYWMNSLTVFGFAVDAFKRGKIGDGGGRDN